MKTISFFTAIVCASLSLSLQSCNKEAVQNDATPQTYQINFKPAKTNSELALLANNPDANIIRNLDQLNYVVNNKLSPLSKLSEKSLALFKSDLPQGEKGFGSINVGILQANLSTEDYNTAMAMFGLDTKDGFWGKTSPNARSGNPNPNLEDGEDYFYRRCDGQHNCYVVTENVICTSNC